MQPPNRLAALTAALLLSAADPALSYNTTPFIGPLDPWQVSRLQITAPAPGRSRPVDIDLAIANPNTVSAGPAPHAAGGGYLPFAPSAANCTISGQLGGSVGETQYTCAETTEFSYGVWGVDVPGGAVDPSGVDIAFTLNYNVTRWGGVLYKVYNGAGRFAVGENLERGPCDEEAGTCEFTLRPDSAPVLVPPTMVACQGTCVLP